MQSALPPRKLGAQLKAFKRLLGHLKPKALPQAPLQLPLLNATKAADRSNSEQEPAGSGDESGSEVSICDAGPDPDGICQGCGGPPGGRGCSWCDED